MKRVLVAAAFAVAATAGMATPALGGAFCIFYNPKYCTSYCQQCCAYNAFSSNGCLLGCCPPPQWPSTGYGCGGCGAYGACGQGGCANGKCGPQGPCCRQKAPTAMQLVESSPQSFEPICCHCGMDTYGTGGLGHKSSCGKKGCKGCKGKAGACVGESCGGDAYYGGHTSAVPMVYPAAPAIPVMQVANPNAMAQYWTANMAQQQAAGYYMQPVSYQGYNYYYPAANYGYYGYYPYYAMPTQYGQ